MILGKVAGVAAALAAAAGVRLVYAPGRTVDLSLRKAVKKWSVGRVDGTLQCTGEQG